MRGNFYCTSRNRRYGYSPCKDIILPPEVTAGTIRVALSQHEEIQSLHDETWSNAYRYAVANGNKLVVIALTKHIPSHITIAGYRVLTSYECQPKTCYGCGDKGHMYQVCPKRRGTNIISPIPTGATWAHITANGTHTRPNPDDGNKDTAHNRNQPEQVSFNQMEDELEPLPLLPPNKTVTGSTDTSRQHATQTLVSSTPARTLWADDDPDTGRSMEAEVEAAEDTSADEKERPPPTQPVKDPDARTDTVKQQYPKDGQIADQMMHPGKRAMTKR